MVPIHIYFKNCVCDVCALRRKNISIFDQIMPMPESRPFRVKIGDFWGIMYLFTFPNLPHIPTKPTKPNLHWRMYVDYVFPRFPSHPIWMHQQPLYQDKEFHFQPQMQSSPCR